MQSLDRPCSDFCEEYHSRTRSNFADIFEENKAFNRFNLADWFLQKQITVYNTQNFQGINPPLARLLLSLNHGHKKKGHTVDTTSTKRKELVHCKNQIDKHATFHTKQITYSNANNRAFCSGFPFDLLEQNPNRNPCLLSILSHFFFVSPLLNAERIFLIGVPATAPPFLYRVHYLIRPGSKRPFHH